MNENVECERCGFCPCLAFGGYESQCVPRPVKSGAVERIPDTDRAPPPNSYAGFDVPWTPFDPQGGG